MYIIGCDTCQHIGDITDKTVYCKKRQELLNIKYLKYIHWDKICSNYLKSENRTEVKIPIIGSSEKKRSLKRHIIKELMTWFDELIQKEKGFKVIFSGADAKAIKQALRPSSLGSPERIKKAILFYLETEKAQKHGYTLSIALSNHSLNLFLQDEADKEDVKRLIDASI